MQPKFQRKKDSSEVVFLSDKARNVIAARMAAIFFTFPLSRGYAFPPFRRPAAAGERGPPGMGDVRHDMACALPPPGGGGKRGRDTKVSLPLLTPQPFLRTRLPSVARLKARGPQGRLVLQGTILDRSGAFRSDGANALHRMAAHCYARRLTQGKFRAVKRPKICPTHGTELPSCPLLPSAVGTASPPPKAAMLTPSEGVISPPAARRCIGGRSAVIRR